MKGSLRFLVNKKETCIWFDSNELNGYQWSVLSPHLRKFGIRGGWFENVVHRDWGCVRQVYTTNGLTKQREERAQLRLTSKLIEADEPTIGAVLLAIARSEEELATMPTYADKPSYHTLTHLIPGEVVQLCAPAA